MSDRRPRDIDRPETDRERRLSNILIFGIIIFIVGAALWLGDALIAARKADDCLASGRRDCMPIRPPAQPVR
jgi:hypothetical protein